MPSQYKVFPDQATADDINTRLPNGVNIQLQPGPQNTLIYPKLSVDSITSRVPVDSNDIVTLGNLPIIELPTDEEMAFLANAPIGDFSFTWEGNTLDTEQFMTLGTRKGMSSNLSPMPIMVPLAIVNISFTNENDNSDVVINLYSKATGQPEINLFTWSPVGIRWGYKKVDDNLTPLALLEQQTAISCSIRHINNNIAKDVVATFYFRMLQDDPLSQSEFISATL